MYFGHRVGRAIPRSVQTCPIGATFVRTAINQQRWIRLDCRSASVGLSALFVGFLHTRCRFLTRDCCPANIPEGTAGFLFIVAQEGMNHRCVSFSPTLSYISTSSVPRTRFAAPCPQCVLWRDDGGCATWYRALPASFRPLAQPVVGIWYSTLVPHPCCHQHCWTRRGGGEI